MQNLSLGSAKEVCNCNYPQMMLYAIIEYLLLIQIFNNRRSIIFKTIQNRACCLVSTCTVSLTLKNLYFMIICAHMQTDTLWFKWNTALKIFAIYFALLKYNIEVPLIA